MNQTVVPNASKELKLQKTTIVKLNTTKLTQFLATTPVPLTTASTAPDCDITTVSTTGIV